MANQDLPPGVIPVEPLGNGIVSAVGDGVDIVVEKSKSTGNYVASKMHILTPAAATAGAALLYEFKGEIADKLFGRKKK